MTEEFYENMIFILSGLSAKYELLEWALAISIQQGKGTLIKERQLTFKITKGKETETHSFLYMTVTIPKDLEVKHMF